MNASIGRMHRLVIVSLILVAMSALVAMALLTALFTGSTGAVRILAIAFVALVVARLLLWTSVLATRHKATSAPPEVPR